MIFAFPPALAIAAAVIPVSVILFLWKSRWMERQLSGVIAPRLQEQLTSSIDWWKRRVKAVLFVMAFILTLIAIARPQWGLQTVAIERDSIDFFIGLDLSRSMLAEDVAGKSRLAAAKESIGKLLDGLGSGDRVGLIVFAGEAYVAAPLTQDHEALRRTLAALEPRLIERQGSNLTGAIRMAEQSFRIGNYETMALVLVSDGEQLQGDAVISARDAARNGIRTFTVGIGSAAGAPIPDRQKNGSIQFVKNEFGNEVTSRLNPRVLQQIAAHGGGNYQPMGEGGSGLLAIYERGLLPLGKTKKEKPTQEPGEYFQWPLALAIAFFLTEMLVSERRKYPSASAR